MHDFEFWEKTAAKIIGVGVAPQVGVTYSYVLSALGRAYPKGANGRSANFQQFLQELEQFFAKDIPDVFVRGTTISVLSSSHRT